MGLLSATAKAAKKLADEWDEAAWLKADPRPEGGYDSKAVTAWKARKSIAKKRAALEGYDSVGKKIPDPDAWDSTEWLAENPQPFAGIKQRDLNPDQLRERKNWIRRKANANPKNKAGISKRQKEWVEKNAEKKKEYQAEYYAGRRDELKAKQRDYNERNRAKVNAKASTARADKEMKTPAYSNDAAIQDIYKQAGLLSEVTGTPYEVDHVFPLRGKNVSGLHVPGNLMITPRELNRSKHASFTPGDDPMRFNAQAEKNIAEQNAEGLLSGIALPGTAGLAGLLAAGQSEDADAGFVTRGGKTLLEAFHGSPHKFDKFSMDQIGTGEGAQAYGHGLYFADSEDVAREYRDRLSVGIDGNDSLTYKIGDSEYVRGDPEWKAIATIQNDGIEKAEELRQIYKNDLAAGEPYINADTVKRYSDALDRVNSGEEWSESAGALYRTEIDVTPESLLDWDKPLSEQPQAVQDMANDYGLAGSFTPDGWLAKDWSDTRGSDVYKATYRQLRKDGLGHKEAQKAVSDAMREYDIKGLTYLDGNSRAVGDGTSNYVIFDDSLINIAERGNADPRLLAGIAGTTAAGLAAPGILNAPPVVAVGTPQADSGILSAQLNNHDQSVDQHMLNLGIDPRENPMYDYGTFLPVRQNIVTGKSEMAMPSFLRDTIRGLIDVAESRNSGVFRPDGLFEMI